MKKYILIVLLIKFSFGFSQEKDSQLSLTFVDSNLKEVLINIEDITEYQFYFIEDWLTSDLISGNYTILNG